MNGTTPDNAGADLARSHGRIPARLQYQRREIDESVVCYTSAGAGAAARIKSAKAYATARAAIPTWCVDGLVCARLRDGTPVVALVVRAARAPGDGPFRGEPWVVGGKWDMVTPWKEFVRAKAIAELFGGTNVPLHVRDPIGRRLFATGWGKDGDGPFGEQGMTLQYCYQVVLDESLDRRTLRADANHSRVLLLNAGRPLPRLHPYVRDVVQLSGWLRASRRRSHL
jgi:hypothetical protein